MLLIDDDVEIGIDVDSMAAAAAAVAAVDIVQKRVDVENKIGIDVR